MEILTNILSKDQVRRELVASVDFLAQRHVVSVEICFGFCVEGPDIQDSDAPRTIPLSGVISIVAERERSMGFRLGVDDFWIEARDLGARFLFCNDSDIHFTSESSELLGAVRARWRACGFAVYPDDLPGASGH